MQLLMQRVICLLLVRTPRSGLIDEPMLRDRSAANTSRGAPLLDDLVITIAKFLISIFHPQTSAIDYIGQFFGIIGQQRRGFNRNGSGNDPIVETDIRYDLVPG